MLSNTRKARSRWMASLLALGLMAGVSGCDSWLAVTNPNQIAGSDTELPVAATGLANGAMATVMWGYGAILTSYSTVTDELDWSGSRDAYQQHDFGNMADPYNEFTDDEFRFISQGRWMADYAVSILEGHDTDGTLDDRTDLARAMMFAAVARIIIADMFDDFVFSDRQVAGAPIGPANMGGLYDQAVTLLTDAMAIATAEGSSSLNRAAQALRARAHHGKAVWAKVGQRPIDMSNNGLVSSASAVSDAQAILAATGGDASTYSYGFQYSPDVFAPAIANWVNSRQEMRVGAAYAEPHPTKPTFIAPWLMDPIDAVVSPELDRAVDAFSDTFYPYMPLVTARELRLIIAEDALAGANTATFETQINLLRALDGLTDFVSGGGGMPTDIDMLTYSRMSNMWLQGRRLADMYRFGITDPMWQVSSTAVTAPGTFLPITIIECRANENIPNTC